MPLTLRVVQEGDTIADIEWDGPVPRVGECIYHPNGRYVMCVKTVTWQLFSERYTAADEPAVTLTV